jgi:hypothetical protein
MRVKSNAHEIRYLGLWLLGGLTICKTTFNPAILKDPNFGINVNFIP